MADKMCPEDREMFLYLTQFRYLDEHLERCQLKCDELEKQNKELQSQCSALEKDKKDITEYLKHSVVAKEKTVDELAEQLESQQQAAEQEREALKLQHSQQLQELQEQIDELKSVCAMQVAKSEEHQMQLMQQLSDTESLEKQLASQKKEHEDAVQSLIMEAELEIDKMTEEMRKMTDDFIKPKTSGIHWDMAQCSEWLEKIQLPQRKKIDLWSEIDTQEKAFNKVTQERITTKKEVKQLKKKCQQLEVKLKDCSITHEHMLAKEEDLRQHLASVSKKWYQQTDEVSQLEAELQRERSRRGELEVDMYKAVIILRRILTDSEKLSETQWKRLLEVLESNVPQGAVSTLSDSAEMSSGGQKLQTTDLNPARAETLKRATDPLFLLTRYRPGDLGLIPRPMWKHRLAVSTSSQVPLSRKLCRQKTSSCRSGPAPQQPDPEGGTSTSAN